MRTVHKTLPDLIKKKSRSIIFWGNVSQHILILFTDYIAHSVTLVGRKKMLREIEEAQQQVLEALKECVQTFTLIHTTDS